jgi:hypothetical protein
VSVMVAAPSLDTLRRWLLRYDTAVSYLAGHGSSVEGRRRCIKERDYFGTLIHADGMREALSLCEAYHEAASGIVNQHDADARQLNFPRCKCPVCVALRPIIEKAEGR